MAPSRQASSSAPMAPTMTSSLIQPTRVIQAPASCPGRGAAWSEANGAPQIRDPGYFDTAEENRGPGSAAHRCALRCARDTRTFRRGSFRGRHAGVAERFHRLAAQVVPQPAGDLAEAGIADD